MTSEKLTQEFIEKVSTAKSPEEIVALAKEKGLEIPQDKAEMLYSQLQSQSGELSDEELDNVAGGKSYEEECEEKDKLLQKFLEADERLWQENERHRRFL